MLASSSVWKKGSPLLRPLFESTDAFFSKISQFIMKSADLWWPAQVHIVQKAAQWLDTDFNVLQVTIVHSEKYKALLPVFATNTSRLSRLASRKSLRPWMFDGMLYRWEQTFTKFAGNSSNLEIEEPGDVPFYRFTNPFAHQNDNAKHIPMLPTGLKHWLLAVAYVLATACHQTHGIILDGGLLCHWKIFN